MPLIIAICDDNENQIQELRRRLDEWSADKPCDMFLLEGRFYTELRTAQAEYYKDTAGELYA